MKKYAYITGADRGLGSALTQLYLEKEYIVFAGQYMPDWHELSDLKDTYQDNLIIVPLDISSDESVNQAATIIKNHTEYLDVLINNAGIGGDRSVTILDELNFELMTKLYNTNTLGPLRVTHSIIDLLLQGESKKLVNISSEAGSIADNWRDGTFGYCMSKTALNMQSAILQEHMKEFGVKVLAFHPGWLRSYMSNKLNEEATEEPIESARSIIQLIEDNNDIEKHMYMDWTGKELPW